MNAAKRSILKTESGFIAATTAGTRRNSDTNARMIRSRKNGRTIMQIEPCEPYGYRIMECRREVFRTDTLEDVSLVLRFLNGSSLSEAQRLSAVAAIRIYDAETRHRREVKRARKERQRQHRLMQVPDPVPEIPEEAAVE